MDKQLYEFLKKYGWEDDQIAMIDSMALPLERKKHIFSTIVKLGVCTITNEEVEELRNYILEAYYLFLKTKKCNFLIATPKTPTSKRDSRYVSIELEKLKEILGEVRIPITVRDIVKGLNLKEGYVDSIALQYYLLTRDKEGAEKYYNVKLKVS